MTEINAEVYASWQLPPAEFSLAPFWFWNDVLEDEKLLAQLDAFQAHGVEAFVIHPRVGLPRHQGWMSRALLDKMRFVIDEAARRGMWVILYDEGMYPSGSASGGVVAENPLYQCRGLVRLNLDAALPNTTQSGVQIGADGEVVLAEDQTLVAQVMYQGQRYAIVDRPVDSVIRGLHFLDEASEEPPEDSPPAADLLNPAAVAMFIRLVYDRYFAEFGDAFGTTIRAIFTDEPMLLGRLREADVMPGTTGILPIVNEILGYDFTEYLPALWDENADPQISADYHRALEQRLETTYYAQLYQWCEAHQIALTGHPAEPDAVRHLRYFHIPGQDIVWRWILPDTDSALIGRQSTQAKAASSVMLHQGRRRNANEFCGAYGHQFTYEEMCWLAHWLLVRGCNLLIPHAFYYSVRGARWHERPPDVGLHSTWWGRAFHDFALACRRLCWLNTDSELLCEVAILGAQHQLPWRAAKACFENQIDFNYLDRDDLHHATSIDNQQLVIAAQRYRVLIVDDATRIDAHTQAKLDALSTQITVLVWDEDAIAACLDVIKASVAPALRLTHAAHLSGLRVRRVRKAGYEWTLLFNETATPIVLNFAGVESQLMLNPYTGEQASLGETVRLSRYDLRVIVKPIM